MTKESEPPAPCPPSARKRLRVIETREAEILPFRQPSKENPPQGENHDPSDLDIIAMTLRHGADYTKRYLDSLARLEACEEDDAHA
jgi:hypothetical protein